MKKLKNYGLDCYHVTMAASRTPEFHVCDIVTSQILAGPVKMNEHKQDEHEDIEKKLDIFHILNGILAKTRIIIFLKRFRGRIVDS